MEGEQKGGLVSRPPPDALRRPYMSCPRFSNSAGALANFRAGGLARGASRVWGSLHRPRALGTNLHSGPGIRRNPLTAPSRGPGAAARHNASGNEASACPAPATGGACEHPTSRHLINPLARSAMHRTHLSDGDSARHKGCKQKSH